MTDGTQQKLTVADFKLTREFTELTQQKYVLKYFENRDALEAVEFAYPSLKDPVRMRNRLASDDRVQAAIARWYGTPDRALMIESLKRDIRRARSERVRFDLKVLLCRIQGFIQ